jgi:chemotaxis protein CheX
MHVSHINPFISSVQLVFETMLNTKVSVNKPFIKKDARFCHDITGIISLSGNAVGTVAVSFPMQTANNAVEAFSGVRVESIDDSFSDAIGELANMIAGNAKKNLEVHNVSISVPTVIIGSGHRLGAHRLGAWIVLECNCALGPFSIEVCIEEVPAPATVGGEAHANSIS